MQAIETIKITIRRGDWWWWKGGYPLGINAPRGNGDVPQMNCDMAAEKAGEIVPWDMGGWGGAFAQLKSIKELQMEFETSDKHKDQLVAIVNRAKTWGFPLQDGMVLSAKDYIIGEHTWTKPEPLL